MFIPVVGFSLNNAYYDNSFYHAVHLNLGVETRMMHRLHCKTPSSSRCILTDLSGFYVV